MQWPLQMSDGKILCLSSIWGFLLIPLPQERDRNDRELDFSAASMNGRQEIQEEEART
jgi:hypothetical protein